MPLPMALIACPILNQPLLPWCSRRVKHSGLMLAAPATVPFDRRLHGKILRRSSAYCTFGYSMSHLVLALSQRMQTSEADPSAQSLSDTSLQAFAYMTGSWVGCGLFNPGPTYGWPSLHFWNRAGKPFCLCLSFQDRCWSCRTASCGVQPTGYTGQTTVCQSEP